MFGFLLFASISGNVPYRLSHYEMVIDTKYTVGNLFFRDFILFLKRQAGAAEEGALHTSYRGTTNILFVLCFGAYFVYIEKAEEKVGSLCVVTVEEFPVRCGLRSRRGEG